MYDFQFILFIFKDSWLASDAVVDTCCASKYVFWFCSSGDSIIFNLFLFTWLDSGSSTHASRTHSKRIILVITIYAVSCRKCGSLISASWGLICRFKISCIFAFFIVFRNFSAGSPTTTMFTPEGRVIFLIAIFIEWTFLKFSLHILKCILTVQIALQ